MFLGLKSGRIRMMNSSMTKPLRNPMKKQHPMMTSMLPVCAQIRLKKTCSTKSVSNKVFEVAIARIFGTMG